MGSFLLPTTLRGVIIKMSYRILIKAGGSTDVPLYKILSSVIDGQTVERSFEDKKALDEYIETELNKGTYKVTDLRIMQHVDNFNVFSDIYGTNNNDGDDDKEENNNTNDTTSGSSSTSQATLKKFNITIDKLADSAGHTHVPNDENIAVATANQNAVEVVSSGENEWTINVNGTLQAYTSTDASQNDSAYEWIGLSVDTGVEDITTVSYNGVALSEDDVKDAESVGVNVTDGKCSSFILWIKAEALKVDPKTITLASDGYETITVTIKVA